MGANAFTFDTLENAPVYAAKQPAMGFSQKMAAPRGLFHDRVENV